MARSFSLAWIPFGKPLSPDILRILVKSLKIMGTDMKKKAILFAFLCALTVFYAGCTSYVPFSCPDNCLNIYDSYWDDFSGRIEIGEIYHYRNKGFSEEMRFKVIRTLDSGHVLVARSRCSGKYLCWLHAPVAVGNIWDSWIKISNECVFLIATPFVYADNDKLREGEYRCIGTWNYTTKGGADKTVYKFADISQGYQENPGMPVGGQHLTRQKETNARKSGKNGENCLNLYNTRWDNFQGTLKVGESYSYSDDVQDERLLFRTIQTFPEVGALIYREAIKDGGKEISKECYFLVISSFAYADNAKLREGRYRCVGTFRYETKGNFDKTVYMLLDEKCPGQYPDGYEEEASKGERSTEI